MDMKLMVVFWIIPLLYVIRTATAIQHLNVILVGIGQNPAYGYATTIPVYRVAFERLRPQYPNVLGNVSIYSIYMPGAYTCAAAGDAMLPLAGNISQILMGLSGVTVIMTPACSAEVMVLGDFAREWNVLLMSSTAGDQALANKVRYPTGVTVAPPDHPSLSLAAQMFLERYAWQNVAFFCDDCTQYPGLGSFFYLSCRNIKKLLETRPGQFNVFTYFFDTPAFNDFESILTAMQSRARVVIIFSIPKVVRKIMITAARLNMTNGDYMFLSSRMARVPGEGKQTWKFGDKDDPVAFEAFRSFAYWEHPAAEWERFMDVMDDVARHAAAEYNLTFTEDDKFNDFSVSAYEMASALVMVLNDSSTIPEIELDGKTLAKRFWKRHFDFPWRSVTIASNGMRLGDVCFYRLNQTSGEMEEAWHYYAAARTLTSVSALADVWRSPLGPPSNIPPCGYLNNRCDKSDSVRILVVAVVICAIVVAIVVLSLLSYRAFLNKKDANNPWWYLDAHQDGQQFVTQTASLMLKTADASLPLWFTTKLWLYQNETVWAERIPCQLSPSQICSIRLTRHTLNSMRSIQHPNVSRFYGVMRHGLDMCLLYEYGSRGNLRQILNDDTIPLEIELQTALIREISSGLHFIHTSSLNFHGALSSLSVMVDTRFGIKLADYGMTNVVFSLTGFHLVDKEDSLQLWMAPEVIVDEEYPGSRSADIYSLGVVIAEVFTRRLPLDVILHSESHIQDCIRLLKKSPELNRIAIKKEELPAHIRDLLKECFLDNADRRPSAKEVIKSISGKSGRNVPGLGRTAASVVDCIISRLERHSLELERRIGERTLELIREEEKVNELLKDILPESIVRKLRDKVPIVAEHFHDASILFTHFPEFALVCSRSQPMFIIRLLHQIYTLLDGILENRSVYKVETIGDSYMVVSGVPVSIGPLDHAREIALLALQMLVAVQPLAPVVMTGVDFLLRLGMHSGPCAAGVIGNRMPRYCLFGDTVNTTSRMESHGEGGRVHISQKSQEILDKLGGYRTVLRGLVEMKGKGTMETYWLLPNTD